MSSAASSSLSYSARVIEPFLSVLGQSSSAPNAQLLPEPQLDQRVSAAYVHALFESAEACVQDPMFAVRRGAIAHGGDVDLFHYVLSSAPTRRAAILAANRFVRLLGDVWTISFVTFEQRAQVRISTRVRAPYAADEFLLGLLMHHPSLATTTSGSSRQHVHLRRCVLPASATRDGLFSSFHLNLGAEVTGFSMDEARLDVPSPTGEQRLHEVLCRHAERVIASLPSTLSWTERTKVRVREQLPSRTANLIEIAAQLSLHPRKLSRLMVREGTTFHDLVDDVRRTRAMELLARAEHSIAEVAALTGFTGNAPFHRAFRRWTAQTPTDYRRALCGLSPGVDRRRSSQELPLAAATP
ncbi:MAG TPA: helix-turn-helix domain-containing protein [Polyangiales bacterium]|nr:helix-turn-helix domain-containing protein [Polyangiales bacterium]